MLLRLAPRRAAIVVAALAVAFAAAPAVTGGSPAVASAGPCSPGTGVTIVLDRAPGDGGGVQEYCATGGGRTAKSAMEAAGVPVEEVSTEPGFVCKIQGFPAEQSCQQTPPASAFWKLYWSNGTSARWNVSSYGYASLRVPSGGSVGWAYQGGGSGAPDSTPSVKPSPSPSPSRPSSGSGGTTKPSASPTPSRPAPSSSPSASETAASAAATASESASPSASAKAERAEAKGKAVKADKNKKSDKKSDARKKDQDDEGEARQRSGTDELAAPSDDETVSSGELTTPVNADTQGMTASDLGLLAVAGICIAGLAGTAVVMARRRRT